MALDIVAERTKMALIFVSYRRADTSGSTGRVCDRLRDRFGTENVFRDIDSIDAGEDFTRVIEQTMTGCVVCLAIIGRHWLSADDDKGQLRLVHARDLVRVEIATALERGIRVIPVLVEGAKMPGAGQLPGLLERLANLNAIEVSDRWFDRDIEELLTGVEKELTAHAERRFRLGLAHLKAMEAGEAFREFLAAAKLGSVEAQHRVARCYENGEGVTENVQEAVSWYRKAAERGFAPAQRSLGYSFEFGKGGLQKDVAAAVGWYRKAAVQEDALAQVWLGEAYQYGVGAEKSDREAVKWYRKAAEQGNAAGQERLGLMHCLGRGVLQDDREAAKWFRAAAEQGNRRAQAELGGMYAAGLGVPRDHAQAVRWLQAAAEQGDAAAQADLASMILHGYGLAVDDQAALEWVRRSCAQNHERGQQLMGWMYESGRGVARDWVAAMKWYRLAAEQGSEIAQSNIGNLYLQGRGVAQDSREAVRWFRLAADQGESHAQNHLGLLYERGEGGLPASDREAIRLFRAAADQENAKGQWNLGRMYASGRGVTADAGEAIKWWQRAAAQGHEGAREALSKLKLT
jgi:TPR repeat protein